MKSYANVAIVDGLFYAKMLSTRLGEKLWFG